ncbi:MAG: serpin family protein [Ruminiclostridium sp.]|nr:serpin family protein [Ruminiclostridium sp.]
MKKIKLTALALLSAFSLGISGCTSVQAEDLTKGIYRKTVKGTVADSDFVNANMNFSLELFKNVQGEKLGENVLISPLSAAMALSLTANGADGETLAEMEKLLGGDITVDQLNKYLYSCLDSFRSGYGFKLKIANSVWIKNDPDLKVEKDFLQNAVDYYDSEVYSENFDGKTVSAVNNWVKANTDGMIPKIIDKIEEDTVMYLINALAFDAEWETIYKDNHVNTGTFTNSNGEKQSVKMMSSTEYVYLEDDNAVGFMKGYKGGKYSFAALLPNENISVKDYIGGLDFESLHKTLSEPESYVVRTEMPKFSFDFGVSLNDSLKAMGMPSAFNSENADFSKMAQYKDKNIYISDVIHKTFISVDEKGTKAGAATLVSMDATGAAGTMEDPKIVILDRPFVFMIIDKETSLPIFMGTVESV